MIDHLISAPDAATAAKLLAPLGLASLDEKGNPSFAGNIILNIGGPNDQSIRVILQDAVWDNTDPLSPVLKSPEVLAADWYCIVAQPAFDKALCDLPDNACRLIADREAAERGESFIRYTAPDLDPGLLSSARVEPSAAGANYPFGAK